MQDKNNTQSDCPLGHDGELQVRKRFPSSYHWDERNLPLMIRPAISPSLAKFLEAQTFFFISTSSTAGHCDCSFRGREYTVGGQPLPAIKVMDEHHLFFPDFSGNGLYNSLGNIHLNAHIGMLFVDFDQQRRARINGVATIQNIDETLAKIWPMAQACIRVDIEQAYGNCTARIPRMRMYEGSDRAFS